MKQLATGSNTGLNFGQTWTNIPLNGTSGIYTNAESRPRNIMVSARMTTEPVIGSTISVRIKIGSSISTARPIANLNDSFVIEDFATHFQRYQTKYPILMGANGTEFDTVSIQFYSDDVGDNSEGVDTILYDMDDVQSVGGQDVSLTNNRLDVNAAEVGGAAPISTSDINTEVDTALTDYDGPTNAEMEARTLPTADYFDPDNDAVANVTLVDTTTANTDIGTVPALDGAGQTVGEAIAKLADDNGGANFDATTDSLEALNANIGNNPAFGVTWEYEVLDNATDPIADALVEAKVGGVVMQSKRTDASGIATFYLAAGTYDFYVTKYGYNFTNPDTEAVS